MSKEKVVGSTRLGTAPVPGLLIKMGLPIIASMLIQALYNIVDSIFVARLGQTALNAVSLAYPVQNLIVAVACGIGVGISTKVSHQLGRKDEGAARRTAAHGLVAALACWLLFALLTWFLADRFLALFTDRTDTVAMGSSYLRIVGLCSFGVFIQIFTERLLSATGRSIHTMWTQLSGAVINIIMDPLLIFGIGPFPRLGVTGAAVATVMGQIFGALLGLFLNHIANKDVPIRLRGTQFSPATFRSIFGIGSATMVIMSISSVTISCLNAILAPLSVIAVNILGIYLKVESFVFMPSFGITNALVPIVSYNYGARDKKRLLEAVRFALLICFLMMTSGMLLVQFGAHPLLTLFNATDEMYRYGMSALRIIACSFPVAAINVVITNVFQALRWPLYSMAATITRQLFILLPSAALLAFQFGPGAVWHAYWIAELVALAMMLFLYRRIYRTLILPLPDRP